MTSPDLRIPDSRPRVVEQDGRPMLAGFECQKCSHPLALPAPWCPKCRGELAEVAFGPGGEVWSSTVLSISLQGRQPPTTLAYIDLDNGPRILAHVTDREQRLTVGQRVALAGTNDHGDVLVELDEGDGHL